MYQTHHLLVTGIVIGTLMPMDNQFTITQLVAMMAVIVASRRVKAFELYVGPAVNTGALTQMHQTQPQLHQYKFYPVPTKPASYLVTVFVIWN